MTAAPPETAFRLAVWNCRGAIDRKQDAVRGLGADVVVVPECAQAPALARDDEVAFVWKGQGARKGLGVFAFGGWRLDPVTGHDGLPWVLPLRLIDPAGTGAALLLAVWTVVSKLNDRPGYAAQVAAAIDAWREQLEHEPAVLAGDLNCAAQGSGTGPHLANVRRLTALGVESAYHAHHGVAHGEETAMTLRWKGRGGLVSEYQCDFVFLSRPLLEQLQRVDVGSMRDWVESGLSDHCPVVVDIARVGHGPFARVGDGGHGAARGENG